MIRCTGLAPWEFEFPFPGSLTSTGSDTIFVFGRAATATCFRRCSPKHKKMSEPYVYMALIIWYIYEYMIYIRSYGSATDFVFGRAATATGFHRIYRIYFTLFIVYILTLFLGLGEQQQQRVFAAVRRVWDGRPRRRPGVETLPHRKGLWSRFAKGNSRTNSSTYPLLLLI